MNANPNPRPAESEYYPRRARWYSFLFSIGSGVQRRLHLERIHLPGDMSAMEFVFSLIVPGYALLLNGRKILGWSFFTLYILAAVVFVVALGYQIGGVGYGLMISTHASSIIFLEGYWFREMTGMNALAGRFVLALVTLLIVWLAIYAPVVGHVQDRWVTALQVRGKVVVMRRLALAGEIRRGNPVMYEIHGGNLGDGHREGGAVWAQAGFGWAPVLAIAGDRVEFSTNSFSVNEVSHPLLSHMPTSGGLIVPEKHWFIWPELAISNPRNAGEAVITAVMLQMASVDETQFVGKPFSHWCGRRQTL